MAAADVAHLLHRCGRAGHHARHGVRRARGQVQAGPGPLVIMDLAMPRDVEPAAASLPGVALIGMDQLSEHATAIRDDDVTAVRAILEAELAAYQSAMDAARVAPTVVALRAKAAKVVDVELAEAGRWLSADDLSGHALDEIAQTVRRVVDKLLHAPTVRVKELAGSPGARSTPRRCEFSSISTHAQSRRLPAPPRRRCAREWQSTRVRSCGEEGARVKEQPLRLGSRRSPMAIAQSRQVADMITERTGRQVEIVGVTTLGDVSRAQLTQIGGTGVFVSALREALLGGEVDLAVHSLKDLPTGPAAGVVLAAVPPRDDPRDALVARDGAKLADLPPGARIGTRLAAPGRAAARAPRRPALRPDPRQRRHQAGPGERR